MLKTSLILSVFLLGCGGPALKDAASIAGADVEPLTEVTITDDCKDGGTYQLTASLDVVEAPPTITLAADYMYTDCAHKGHTVSGTVSYASAYEQLPTDEILTTVSYDSNLVYSGDHSGTCVASVAYLDQAEKPDKVSVAKSCPHPYSKAMGKLEKCRFKGKKKPKKKDCEIL